MEEGDISNRVTRLEPSKVLIRCDQKDVVVENFCSFDTIIIPKRIDGQWLSVQTKENTQHINLSSGELIIAPKLNLWRSKMCYSPNGTPLSVPLHSSNRRAHNYAFSDVLTRPLALGNLLLIDAGIMASSAVQLFVVDISDLNNYNVIYREEIWDTYLDYDCYFNSESEFVMKYSFDVFEYEGTIVNEDNIDQIKQLLVDEGKFESIDCIGDREMWKSGVSFSTKSSSVIRKYDESKVTPSTKEKWLEKLYIDPTFEARREAYRQQGLEFYQAHNKAVFDPPTAEKTAYYKQFRTRYDTTCTVNEMTTVGVVEPENFEKFLEQFYEF